jgi:hypothetical protein
MSRFIEFVAAAIFILMVTIAIEYAITRMPM